MAKRSSRVEQELRIQELLRATIDGYGFQDIVNLCKDRWNVTSSRTVDKYLKVVRERLQKGSEEEIEVRRATQIERYLIILRKLKPRLFREVPVLGGDGKPVKKKGKAVTEEKENDTAVRLYLMTCRRLDRISGTESVTHKLEGLVNFKTADVNLTEKDQKEYDAALAAFFGGKAPKN